MNKIAVKLKRLCGQTKIVQLVTRHPDGDKYRGQVLVVTDEAVLVRVDDDLRLDGFALFPLSQIKSVVEKKNATLLYKLLVMAGQITKPKDSRWFSKIKSVQHLIEECRQRKIWPVVEVQFRDKTTALYIGPITATEAKAFCIYCYDAYGKWEKNYRVLYEDVFKVEISDSYSTAFNRYMKTKITAKVKQAIMGTRLK